LQIRQFTFGSRTLERDNFVERTIYHITLVPSVVEGLQMLEPL